MPSSGQDPKRCMLKTPPKSSLQLTLKAWCIGLFFHHLEFVPHQKASQVLRLRVAAAFFVPRCILSKSRYVATQSHSEVYCPQVLVWLCAADLPNLPLRKTIWWWWHKLRLVFSQEDGAKNSGRLKKSEELRKKKHTQWPSLEPAKYAVIFCSLDMRGLIGAETVMGSLMYGRAIVGMTWSICTCATPP